MNGIPSSNLSLQLPPRELFLADADSPKKFPKSFIYVPKRFLKKSPTFLKPISVFFILRQTCDLILLNNFSRFLNLRFELN